MSSGTPQEIPISELPVNSLNQLNQQLDTELDFMSNSLQQLKEIQTKFVQSQECLGKIIPDNAQKEILVPLTSSMYITGQMDDVKNVLLDVGTGYYVEKSVDEAHIYFKKKIEYLTKQMENIQPALQEKYKVKQAVAETLQMKIQAQVAAHASGQSKTTKS